MVFKRGHKVWNKGLTKETDKRINEYSKKLSLTKTQKRKAFNIKCKKCKKLFKIKITDKQYKNKKYKKYCSYKCSNSRIQTNKINKKRSNSLKGKKNFMYGKKLSQETKNKISKSKKGKSWEEIYGKEKTKKLKSKYSMDMKKRFIGNKNPSKNLEVKRKQRIAALKRIMKIGGGPNIGKHEKQILDKVEKEIGYKIIRQYHIKQLGYVVDGYCIEINTIYEVDEKPKTKERDIRREKEIKDYSKCKFIRIKDNI